MSHMRQKERFMDIKDFENLLKSIPLFSMLSEKDHFFLAEKTKITNFHQGEAIEKPRRDALTVIISGSAAVMKNDLLMRILSPGSVSGVASVYGSDAEEVSTLRANTAASVGFIDGSAIRELIRKNPDFAESYITFLTSRIRFLNTRIRAYTSGSAEARLAFHLLYSDESASGKVDIGVSMSALADMLDIGRASLYRAFDALTAAGAIARNGSTVEILNRNILKEF